MLTEYFTTRKIYQIAIFINMRKLVLFLLFSSFACLCIAQEQKEDHQLVTKAVVRAGVAIPLGEFGSSRETDKSGFAQVGRSIGAGIYYPLSKGIDLAINYTNNSFTINREKFDNYLQLLLKREINSVSRVTEEFSYQSNLGSYSHNNLSLGIKFDIKFNESTKMYFTPSVSYNWLKIPDIGFSVKDSAYEFAGSEKTSAEPKLAFTLSSGLEHEVSEDLNFIVDVSLFNSTHDSEGEAVTTNGNGDFFIAEDTYETKFSAFTVSVGLVFRLSKGDN